MNVLVLGAAGFLGINIIRNLSKDVIITAVDRSDIRLRDIKLLGNHSVTTVVSDLTTSTNYEELLENQDIVYHLLSTNVPGTSNVQIVNDFLINTDVSIKILEACVHQKIKKLVFFSSGGTIYGKNGKCPLREDDPTDPITSYGVQKLTIEKLLYLYNYVYGLDYRIIRLSNPYGPFQRPNGVQGAVSTFTYNTLLGNPLEVYGDGSVIRDYLFVDDAMKGIINIVSGESDYRVYNLGCGYGTSIIQIIETIKEVFGTIPEIKYLPARSVDVPVNYLDISRYECIYGKLNPIPLNEGIKRTAEFMKQYYSI